jgi:hypothetical protein
MISKFPKAKTSRNRGVGKTGYTDVTQCYADHNIKHRISENSRFLGAAIAAHRTSVSEN